MAEMIGRSSPDHQSGSGPPAAGLSAQGTGALVFVGFMGAGKSSSARQVAAELAVDPLDSDRELEAELGETIESFFEREGEAAFREREEDVVLRLLERGDGGVVALGGGRARFRARPHGAGRPHGRTPRGRARRGLAAGIGQGPPARARPRPLRPASRRPRRAVRLDRPRRPAPRRARQRAQGTRGADDPEDRARRRPRFDPHGLGRGGVGQLPRIRRFRPRRLRFLLPRRGAAVRRDRRERRRPSPGGGRPHDRDRGGRGAEDHRGGRGRPPRSCPCRRGARRHRRGGRRRRGRRSRGFLRGRLPARDAPRPGADHARRPGRLGIRREDRGRPARGEELRRGVPPADSP